LGTLKSFLFYLDNYIFFFKSGDTRVLIRNWNLFRTISTLSSPCLVAIHYNSSSAALGVVISVILILAWISIKFGQDRLSKQLDTTSTLCPTSGFAHKRHNYRYRMNITFNAFVWWLSLQTISEESKFIITLRMDSTSRVHCSRNYHHTAID